MVIDKQKLLTLYSSGKERCGFIVDGSIVEVENVAATPEEGFAISVDDVMKYSEVAQGTWHTHPDESSNLSGEDYSMFTMWKDLYHIIIGNDGLKVYQFSKEKKSVMVVPYE